MIHTARSTPGWTETLEPVSMTAHETQAFIPMLPAWGFMTFLSQWVSFGKRMLIMLGWFIACWYHCLFKILLAFSCLFGVFFKARGSRVLLCTSTSLRTSFSVTSLPQIVVYQTSVSNKNKSYQDMVSFPCIIQYLRWVCVLLSGTQWSSSSCFHNAQRSLL